MSPDAGHDRLPRCFRNLPYLQTSRLAPLTYTANASRPTNAGKLLERALVQAIQSLRPANTAAVDARARRCHALLVRRFVDGGSVASVSEGLGISESEYYRELHQALGAVVSVLWETWGPHWSESDPASGRSRVTPADPAKRQSPAGAWRAAGNLPPPLTSFVGRERELKAVGELLAGASLVTLTGAAGCGKTRLALECAREGATRYPDGVWLVDLAGLNEPHLTAHVVAGAVGCRGDQPGPLLGAVTRHLAGKRALLVLDNCEHLIGACAELASALLSSCPTLSLLATSRERLLVAGEHVYQVPPLSVPEAGGVLSLANLAAYDGPRLFRDRATACCPGFTLTPDNASAVAGICAALDGLPLAIELAAAWTPVLPADELLARLHDRFRLLTGGYRGAPPRQQSLLAMVEWSYALLTEAEATLFRRLSVFAGGWDLDAAEAVCAGGYIGRQEVLVLIARLVDKSMVVATNSTGAGRYRLLETLREFGATRLAQGDDAGLIREQYVDYYTSLAERAECELTGPRQREWLSRLVENAPNLRQVLRMLLEACNTNGFLRLAGALWRYWAIEGMVDEGRECLRQALYSALSTDASAPESALIAKAMQGAGALARMQGAFAQSQTMLIESAHRFRDLGDLTETARSLVYLAWTHIDSGDLTTYRPVIKEALATARAAGDPVVEGWALARLGHGALLLGELAAAARLFGESIRFARSTGDSWMLAWSLGQLSTTYSCGLGEPVPGEIERLEVDVIRTWRELGSRRDLAYSLYILAHYYTTTGRSELAEPMLREAISIASDVGDALGMVEGLLYWATHAQFARDPERALTLLGAALAAQIPTGITLPPVMQAWCSRIRAGCSALQDNEASEAALLAGHRLTLEQAVRYALGR